MNLSETPTYRTWKCMIARCHHSTASDYSRYGAKGISVCKRWRDSFSNFLKDMGERPTGKYIDRINGSGNYEPSNCRWATRTEQNNNKRSNVRIEFNGKNLTAAEWSRITSISHDTICQRIKRGWPISALLSTPPMTQREKSMIGQRVWQLNRLLKEGIDCE